MRLDIFKVISQQIIQNTKSTMQLIQDSKIAVIDKYDRNQYGQFNSQRAQTEQESYFQNRILNDQNNQLSLEIPLHHPAQQILKSMQQALRQKNFKGVEIFGSSMLIVRMSKLDRIKKILFCINPPKYLVKFNTLEYASKRLLTLKSLYFNADLQQMKTVLKVLQNAILPPPQVQQQQYRQDMYSLDATASYMFDKILLNQKYSIGKKMHMLLKLTYLHSQQYPSMNEDISSISSNERNFLNSKLNSTGTRQSQSHLVQDDFSNPPPPLTIIEKMSSQKLQWIHHGLEEIGDDMLSTFNCSRKQLVQILGFCRKTVEQYYYFTLTQKQANNSRINYNNVQGGESQNLSLSIKSLKNCKDLEGSLPITKKQFNKLIFCNSSQQIFKRLFYIFTLFKCETQLLKLGKDEIVDQIDAIKEKYSKILESKLKIMQISGFRAQFMQYAQDFIS